LFSAEKVIAISNYTAKDAQQHLGLPNEKINMVYEGGPEPKPLPAGHTKKIHEYLKTNEQYFLFVSQWRPHKGIITLIDAYNQFKKATGSPYKLVLTGRKDASEAQVMSAWKKSPYKRDIITPGFVPEALLSSLYANAVALAVPSEYEGFGLTPLEAFTYETPVIAADNSSLTEVVGNGGLLFETRNAEQLAKHLEKVANSKELRQTLIEKGKQQLKQFSWSHAAEETLATYNEILAEKSGNSR
jgi:glycosyltransferase involved in cell wall biosynthesis